MSEPKTQVKPHTKDDVSLILDFLDSMRTELVGKMPDSYSYIHIKTLDIISRKGEPSMSEVTMDLCITSPGTTLIVDKLVENGDIERVQDPNDRRVVRLKVTTAGKAKLKKGKADVGTRIIKKLSVLSHEEKEKFLAILEKLITK